MSNVPYLQIILFIAELNISDRKKDKTREYLDWIINAPLNNNHESEDESYKGDAEELLGKIVTF